MTQPAMVKTTCPRDCYDACGISVLIKDGGIARILGDRDHAVAHGALCGKCALAYNGAWRDERLRLAVPLRRVGRKGGAEFEKISWEAALTEIAARLQPLIASGEAHRILHTHYTGTVGLIQGWFPIRFFNRVGATEIDPDTVCNKAGHTALEMTFGDSLQGFDPRTAKDSRTILVWGANPSNAAPHQNRYWLGEARARGAKIIVVDPIAHDTANAADIHLKLRPGTDAVLAFAMLHVMRRDRLVDDAFLDAYVKGAGELAAPIEATSPARAAEICCVPEEFIDAAATAYAEGPSLLWFGQGVQRQQSGGNVFRALAALIAFSGNLGRPGAGFLYMNGSAGRGVDMATLTVPSLARGGGSISHMDFAGTLEDPSKSAVIFNWNNNPAASSPDQGRLRRALQREDLFHVAVDLFQTDTTAYADIILPATSFLECNDLILPYFDLTLSAQVKVSEATGEALPNSEIFRRLARALAFNEEELFESDEALIARLIAQTPYQGTFAELCEVGTVTLFPQPQIQFADLTFATPSGRIELASERAFNAGLPRTPLPHADAPPAEGRLRVLSPASRWLMNSSYGNDEAIRERLGPPTVTLHPTDAARARLSDGDAVLLVNESGQLPLTASISDKVQPGVALVYKGRWPSASPGDANVNTLVSGRKSDMGESTTVHGTEAEIIRAPAV